MASLAKDTSIPEVTRHRAMMREGSERLLRALRPELTPRAPSPPPSRIVRPVTVRKRTYKVWRSWEIAPADPVIERVSEVFRIPIDALLGHDRGKHLVDARTVVALVLREMGWSYPRIGAALSRDHSTVINLCDRYAHRSRDPYMVRALAAVRRTLDEELSA